MATRILHISNSAYESLEDAGPSLAIYRELAKGVEAYHVLAPNKRRRLFSEQDGNLTIHLLPSTRGREFFIASYAAYILTGRYAIQVITSQDPLLGGVAAVHVGRLRGIPVMVELHTDVYFGMLRSTHPMRRAAGRAALYALKGADRVRVSTPSLGAGLAALGVDPRRMVEVPYRVDTNFFAPYRERRAAARQELGLDAESVFFVSVGRFVPQKGYPLLVDAFANVLARQPRARLVLAGGGPLGDELRALRRAKGLDDVVEIWGWVSREHERCLLAAADVYVQPSLPGLGEWMPRTILEAMSMGVPVVASAVGGIGDIINKSHGALVPAGDKGALVRVLTNLAGDGARRSTLGRNARAVAVECYGWEGAFALYREALHGMA